MSQCLSSRRLSPQSADNTHTHCMRIRALNYRMNFKPGHSLWSRNPFRSASKPPPPTHTRNRTTTPAITITLCACVGATTRDLADSRRRGGGGGGGVGDSSNPNNSGILVVQCERGGGRAVMVMVGGMVCSLTLLVQH